MLSLKGTVTTTVREEYTSFGVGVGNKDGFGQ
jgi:hypothetical protein